MSDYQHSTSDLESKEAWPFSIGHGQSDQSLGTNGNTPDGEVGVADYYRRKPKRATSTLVALAPDVLLLARCEGAPETAKYFTERLGVNVTEKMVKTLKAKVRCGALVVTREELEAAARSHAITAARMIREPSICDPQHYRAAITPEEEELDEEAGKKVAAKKPAAKKTAAKKAAAKKVTQRTEKTAEPEAHPTETPTPKVEPPPSSAIHKQPGVTPQKPSGLQQIVSDEQLAHKQALLAQLKKDVRGENNS